MKKFLLLVILVFLFSVNTVHAIPFLQLDIGGGTYDDLTETVVSKGDVFTLYALMTPNQKNLFSSDAFYISAAVTPKVNTPSDLGSISIDGVTYNITDDMVYGRPPLDDLIDPIVDTSDSGDLAPHGIYDTYYTEIEFYFDFDNNKVGSYNSQDNTGQFESFIGGTGSYYQAFSVDTSNLGEGYEIHFDLYSSVVKSSTDIDVDNFAPFSHDAESSPVPEPATLFLFGLGLLGFGGVGRKKLKI